MTPEEVKKIVEIFRGTDRFVHRDWEYTRLHDIKHIRYKNAWRGYDSLGKRIKRAFAEPSFLKGLNGTKNLKDKLLSKWCWLRVSLRTDDHTPDGVLDGGKIITFWEEDGEYLQLVQPSVGMLIADWLDAEPESEYAQRVAEEMRRIQDSFYERVKKGEVDGRVSDDS